MYFVFQTEVRFCFPRAFGAEKHGLFEIKKFSVKPKRGVAGRRSGRGK